MKKIVLLIAFLFSVNAFSTTNIKLDDNNTIPIVTEISGPLVFFVAFKLMILNSMPTNSPIYFYMDSPGGSVAAEEAIINLANRSRRPVHTVTVFAASAAFNIVQGLGKRYITSYAVMLTHFAFMQMFQITPNSVEVAQQAKDYLMKVYSRTAKRLKMDINEYMEFMSSETLVRGSNNVTINAADEIVNIECSKPLILSGACPR